MSEHEWLKVMVDERESSIHDRVSIGLNLYNFKKSSMFQSSIVAFMSGLLQQDEEI